MLDHQVVIDWLDSQISERPAAVIVAFLVVTAVFAVGLGNVSTSAGTEQFTQDVPAQQAYDHVTTEFGRPFAPDTGSTQLIQTGQNVLSKRSLSRMLTVEDRISSRTGLRVSGHVSAADVVATQLDPNATTLQAKRRAVRQATPTEIDTAVRRAARNPGFVSQLSNDFNAQSASASATVAVITHQLPGGLSQSVGSSGSSPLQRIQLEERAIAGSVGGDFRVFGSGIIAAEFSNVIFDSLVIVIPAAVLLIVAFLVFAYRDPLDLLLGIVSLGMAILWTLGFMGLANIPFTQMLVAVPPLLLAVGIDFGIHAINRYREERALGKDVVPSMRIATDQLVVAFFIVTGTTVIGFAANTTSSLGPIREFGIIAAIGITFTFLIFGIFLPAAKVLTDQWRERLGIPAFGVTPLGDEESLLGKVLPVGVTVARRAPYAFLVLILLSSVVLGYYGTGVDTSFSQQDFLPPEHVPAFQRNLPEPFAPGTYTVTRDLNFLEDHFTAVQGDTVTIYVQGPLREDYALESIHHASRNPPSSFVTDGRTARTQSIITVIHQYERVSPSFRRLVQRSDANDDGVPDDNLGQIYAQLLDSPYRQEALSYITGDQRATRVVYTTKSSASDREITADARAVADRYRLPATATGSTVVFQAVSDGIFESALRSLVVAIAATAVFLVLVYWLLEGKASLGVANLVPILVTLTWIAGSMRYFDVAFNALTATVLSIAIGMGIDYSSHFVHRFADEYEANGKDVFAALDRTVLGTGGALTGSMLTTTTGIGVLVLAITPILGEFGLVTALAILYSFLSSLVVTPAVLVVWDDLVGGAAESVEPVVEADELHEG